MDEPTKDTENTENTDNSGDMLEALKSIRAKEEDGETKPKEEVEPEPEPEPEPTKEDGEDEGGELDLTLPEGDVDIKAWIAQKEKGVEKVVNRAKQREADAQERISEADKAKQDAAFYLENKEAVDSLVATFNALQDPTTRDAALEEFSKVGRPEFEPEFDSDRELLKHVDTKTQAYIKSLEDKINKLTEPLMKDYEQRESTAKLEQRINDSYEAVALEIAKDCNGYQVSRDDFREAVKSNPDQPGADAVKRHLFGKILEHTAERARSPKKQEMVDGASKKDVAKPESSDMYEVLQHMRATGQLSS